MGLTKRELLAWGTISGLGSVLSYAVVTDNTGGSQNEKEGVNTDSERATNQEAIEIASTPDSELESSDIRAPVVFFEFEYDQDDDTLTVIKSDGEQPKAGRLYLTGDVNMRLIEETEKNAGDYLETGEEVKVGVPADVSIVRVVWRLDDSEETLDEWVR
jgi:hypothetical protein